MVINLAKKRCLILFISNLFCTDCVKKFPPSVIYHCPNCGGILEVNYKYEKVNKVKFKNKLSKFEGSMWQYKDLLPLSHEKNIVSMNEGLTPLIELRNLAKEYHITNIFIKNETCNPTGSFKDRPTSVGISKAIELGSKTVSIASSGNAGASVAGYAARAGIKSYVFIPENTPVGKVNQAIAYGAQIIKVKGTYSNSYKLALAASEKYNWVNLTSTYLNPYTLEGNKTIAYEIYHQLDGEVPENIFVPIGAGPLLYGILKGFKELKNLGFTRTLPAMFGVQAEQCSPIIQAYRENKQHVDANPLYSGRTIASAIADPLIGYENNGTITLRAIYESNGMGVSLTEDEIKEAVFELGEKEGMYAEPAAAASWGGYKKLIIQNKIPKKGITVLLLTGHGLKQPLESDEHRRIPVIEPSLEDLERKLEVHGFNGNG